MWSQDDITIFINKIRFSDMSKMNNNKDLEMLNSFLAEQIKGGNQPYLEFASGSQYTCIYNRKERTTEGWEDDSQGNPIRRIEV